jgi:capsular exopolysaccharide synthesis family protein
MSRVEEALRRAAAAPLLAGVIGQIAKPAAERWVPSGLEHYPREDPSRLDAIDGSPQTLLIPACASGRLSSRDVAPRFNEIYRGKLVATGDASPASVEQYRRLAAAVHHVQVEQGLRTLMVSSSVPREGKTLTVVNLATMLSESYKRRVLLIDADLLRPSIHHVFGISNSYGLWDALEPETGRLQFSRVSPTLWVLPAGSAGANPMAVLASQRMERLLNEVATSFDCVLIDAPPVAQMPDAGLLARLIGAVIVVIAAGSTPYRLVEKVVAELGRDHVIGTVLNRIEEDATGWSAQYAGYDAPARPAASLR